jgi:hypothetical protein
VCAVLCLCCQVEEGPVLHTYELVCARAGADDGVDRFGRFWNLARTRVASVVHQWDRCPQIVPKVDALFPFSFGYLWGQGPDQHV